jgi:hypothetical protein
MAKKGSSNTLVIPCVRGLPHKINAKCNTPRAQNKPRAKTFTKKPPFVRKTTMLFTLNDVFKPEADPKFQFLDQPHLCIV